MEVNFSEKEVGSSWNEALGRMDGKEDVKG